MAAAWPPRPSPIPSSGVGADNIVADTPPRGQLRAVQTPQGFSRDLLCRAHAEITERCTDDAALVEQLGVPVHLCPGSPHNLKLTTPEDIALAEFFLSGMPRIGHGYDAHRLVEGRRFILGGVDIPHEKGCWATATPTYCCTPLPMRCWARPALGDIGRHFPDKDPQYEGISSLILLQKTAEILRNHGLRP